MHNLLFKIFQNNEKLKLINDWTIFEFKPFKKYLES